MVLHCIPLIISDFQGIYIYIYYYMYNISYIYTPWDLHGPALACVFVDGRNYFRKLHSKCQKLFNTNWLLIAVWPGNYQHLSVWKHVLKNFVTWSGHHELTPFHRELSLSTGSTSHLVSHIQYEAVPAPTTFFDLHPWSASKWKSKIKSKSSHSKKIS